MAWQKGQSGNPGGLNTRQARVRNMIEGLSMRAVERLGALVQSENESVALGAIKEVLGRVAPVPKNGTLSVEVNHNSPHLVALTAMAAQTLARVQPVPVIDAQPIDNISYHLKPTGSDNVDAALLALESDERDD